MGAETVRTAGVDLAAESTRTALAVIEWGDERARVTRLDVGVADAEIVQAAADVGKLGIDCALGWPDEFVSFVHAHSRGAGPQPVDGGAAWRRTLAFRETDRAVRERIGRWPLSVSTDRLGLTTMRCAGLLGRLAQSGLEVDRSGTAGVVAEVYPGASLRLWGLHAAGYRAEAEVRRSVIRRLASTAPWLDLSACEDLMVASSDALDAVVAALTARAAALGLYEPPALDQLERARREGWIVLPSVPLADLSGEAQL